MLLSHSARLLGSNWSHYHNNDLGTSIDHWAERSPRLHPDQTRVVWGLQQGGIFSKLRRQWQRKARWSKAKVCLSVWSDGVNNKPFGCLFRKKWYNCKWKLQIKLEKYKNCLEEYWPLFLWFIWTLHLYSDCRHLKFSSFCPNKTNSLFGGNFIHTLDAEMQTIVLLLLYTELIVTGFWSYKSWALTSICCKTKAYLTQAVQCSVWRTSDFLWLLEWTRTKNDWMLSRQLVLTRKLIFLQEVEVAS